MRKVSVENAPLQERCQNYILGSRYVAGLRIRTIRHFAHNPAQSKKLGQNPHNYEKYDIIYVLILINITFRR